MTSSMERPIITASECRKHLRECAGVESKVTETMAARVDAAVRRALKAKQTSAIVTIPSYVFGLPDFDIDNVQKSVKAIFANAGFKIKPCKESDYTFELDWTDHDTVRPSPILVPRTDSMFFDAGMDHTEPSSSLPNTRSIQVERGPVIIEPKKESDVSKTISLTT